MKFITRTLITLILTINTLFADISKDDLRTYLSVSAGGAMFASYHFDTLIKLAEYGFDKTSLKKMVDDEKYLNIYTKNFIKMSNQYYTKIIKFYETDVGGKYTQAIYDIANIHKDKFPKLYNQNKCSKEQQNLINNIVKEFNLIELKMIFLKKYNYEINDIQLDILKKSIYDMEISETTYKSKLTQRQKMISCIMYKKFTLEELQILYQYASSNEGKYETNLMYESFAEYIKVFFHDLESIKFISNEKINYK